LAGAFVAFVIGKTGGTERVRKTRAEQGTLIASGLMAGAAIFGILVAVLRLPDIGAPIRRIAIGISLSLKDGQLVEGAAAGYFENYGQIISLAMLIVLSVACYLLAKWGAKGTILEEDAADLNR
jgi:hypothetical protein